MSESKSGPGFQPESTPPLAATPASSGADGAQVDPRGLRFAAGVTTVVLAAVLIIPSPTISLVLLGAQTLVFAIGAGFGPAAGPYARLFRGLIRPRLGPPTELEPAAPPRFAQAVGLGFSLIALVAFLFDVTVLGTVAVALALAAAFANAAFGFCLGCEVYLLLRRALSNRSHQSTKEA